MVNGTDVGELVPQEVYSRGGGYCDGGGRPTYYVTDRIQKTRIYDSLAS